MGCLTAERSLLDPTTIEGLTLFYLIDLQATPQLPVSGVSLWLRAQDARILNSQTVWADRSGLSVTVSGPALLIEAANVNGRPAVYFPGTLNFVNTLAPQLISSTNTILVAFKNGT